MLPTVDHDYLQARAPGHTVCLDGGAISIVIPAFTLPSGFTHVAADLLLRLSPGYPDVAPDMWWFAPAVLRVDGKAIVATQSMETYFGRTWQRWSRHLQNGHWRSGIDSLECYIALVRQELDAAAKARAA